MSDRVVRVEPVDHLAMDDGALLLYERRVLRVNELGASIFEWCEQPRAVSELASLLAEEFGSPPEADIEEATLAVVTELQERGVLKQTGSES